MHPNKLLTNYDPLFNPNKYIQATNMYTKLLFLDNGRLNNRLLPSRRNHAMSSIQKNINTPADQNIQAQSQFLTKD